MSSMGEFVLAPSHPKVQTDIQSTAGRDGIIGGRPGVNPWCYGRGTASFPGNWFGGSSPRVESGGLIDPKATLQDSFPAMGKPAARRSGAVSRDWFVARTPAPGVVGGTPIHAVPQWGRACPTWCLGGTTCRARAQRGSGSPLEHMRQHRRLRVGDATRDHRRPRGCRWEPQVVGLDSSTTTPSSRTIPRWGVSVENVFYGEIDPAASSRWRGVAGRPPIRPRPTPPDGLRPPATRRETSGLGPYGCGAELPAVLRVWSTCPPLPAFGAGPSLERQTV